MWYCSPGFLEGKSKMFYSPGELILDWHLSRWRRGRQRRWTLLLNYQLQHMCFPDYFHPQELKFIELRRTGYTNFLFQFHSCISGRAKDQLFNQSKESLLCGISPTRKSELILLTKRDSWMTVPGINLRIITRGWN